MDNENVANEQRVYCKLLTNLLTFLLTSGLWINDRKTCIGEKRAVDGN